jgi:pimeloyl-ACP methyl ester carboxylesterase
VTEKRSIVLLHGVQSSQLTWWRLKQDLQDLGGRCRRSTCWVTDQGTLLARTN